MMSIREFVRRRRALALAIIAAATLGAAGTAWAVYGGGGDAAPEPTASSSSRAEPTASPSPEPQPSSSEAPLGALVLTTAVDSLDVYATPGDAAPSATLGEWSAYGLPLTLLGTTTTELDGQTWIRALLPIQPNGTAGWVRADDVTVTSTTNAVHVYLDEMLLEYTEDGVVTVSTTVAVGAPDTPTPLGTFYVTDPLDLTTNPTGSYGAYAIGLSGFSAVLAEFAGGPPQIAIHGTNRPELLGQAVSNGCVRLPNEAILKIAATITLGTPVTIEATRTA
jgi:lipoprotein-anchoring transpeptidase ErfK/SrfK